MSSGLSHFAGKLNREQAAQSCFSLSFAVNLTEDQKLAPICTDQGMAWIVPGSVFMLNRQHELWESFGGNHTTYNCNTATAKALSRFLPPNLPVSGDYLYLVANLFMKYVEPIGFEKLSFTLGERTKLLMAERTLWVAVFECLKEINCQGAWGYPFPYVHPGLALAQLIQDGYLVAMLARGADAFGSADKQIRHEQSVTRKLQNDENIFPEGSFTHSFIESCLKLARPAKNAHFAYEKWQPILKARSALTTEWKKSKPLKTDVYSGRPERPRSKRSKKKTT
jgi:hypothetical protein